MKTDTRNYGKFHFRFRKNFADGGEVDAEDPAAYAAPEDEGMRQLRQLKQLTQPRQLRQPTEPTEPTAQDFTPEGYRPGLQARQAAKYPGWPTMSIDPAWENHPAKKSAYERINPDWGTAI